jgi:predicted exporter
MSSRAAPAIWIVLWIVLIGLLGWLVSVRLRISGDLRLFMPAPHSSVERLLLEEVSEGPAARLLLVALEGADAEALADSSQQLAAALRTDPAFRLIANGENRLDSVPDALLPYRYLLSPTLDHEHLDASLLRSELTARERDLASPAASLLEPLLPRDPTLEILKLLQSWQPSQEPRQIDDVWFNASSDAALLVVETTAPAFDPEGQRAALTRLQAHFASTRANPAIRLTASGPGAFSVLMQARSELDARLAGILDTAGMIALMLIAYRRVRFVVLGALPLATAGIVGLATVAALFGTVHGITIAFGFTLIGVAIDYPIYLFSHRQPGDSPLDTARTVGPTLVTAVVAICIAYLAFLLSGVAGLAQLACFNVSGLAAAGLCTRVALPRLLPAHSPDYGAAALPRRLAALTASLPRLPWLAPAAAIAGIAVLALVPGPLWENDLGRLTPVPAPRLMEYESLRRALGAPDIRYMLAIEGKSADEVLAREEALAGALDALVSRGAISRYDFAARYLASRAVQLRRRDALPDAPALQAALDAATRGLAFRPGLFAPFLEDVERARALPPLTTRGVAGTPLELSTGSLLIEREGRWIGLTTLTDVRDAGSLAAFAASSGGGVSLLDLKLASENLVARQRVRILWSVAAAALLLALVVRAALHSTARAWRVMTPMLLSSLLTLAVLHAAGFSLNLFHLIALVLAAGLGLDYGLFVERAAHDPGMSRRTLHALTVCAAAACVVFAVLASSTLPVLRSIGVTVVLGVLGNFLLALALIAPRTPRAAGQP